MCVYKTYAKASVSEHRISQRKEVAFSVARKHRIIIHFAKFIRFIRVPLLPERIASKGTVEGLECL